MFSYCIFLINGNIVNNVDATDIFPRRIKLSMSLDDLVKIQKKPNSTKFLKLCNNPKLKYLNLLDYEGKVCDFHSSIFNMPPHLTPYTFAKTFEAFEEYISAGIFYFYINYLKNIPKYSIDLQAFKQKIPHVAVNLEHCDSGLIHTIIHAIIHLYSVSPSEKILLPLILKHLCTSEELVVTAAQHLFKFCNESFFKELLDASIESRFSFWTMWERNLKLSTIPFCPVTYAYSSAQLDLLKVLLDYGFYPTHQKVGTFEVVLPEHLRYDDYVGLMEFLFNGSPNSRSAVIDEVFLFVGIIFNDCTNSEALAKSFLLSWDARKEPYVTNCEVLNSLKNRIGPTRKRDYETTRLWFQRCFDAFQIFIPDYQGLVLQPRSLKHLCRCTVREALNDNWEMPYGVANIPIPAVLKSYILLK